jgi:hypothetical protein
MLAKLGASDRPHAVVTGLRDGIIFKRLALVVMRAFLICAILEPTRTRLMDPPFEVRIATFHISSKISPLSRSTGVIATLD